MNTSLTSVGGGCGGAEANAKVSVAVRVRPLIERECKQKEGSGINWIVDQNFIQQVVPNTDEVLPGIMPYMFDHVFSINDDTKEVYNRVVSPIVDQAFSGFNGTVLCYGQTSSGKTFTLYGTENENGILSLTAQHLFKRISEDKDRTYIVRLGLIEIYNEKVSDLLSENRTEIPIVEINGCIVPKELEEIEIFKPEDMLAAMHQVQKRRKVGETRLNQDSSRSHTIMRILLESVPKADEGQDTVTTALLNFVDLAGSEKVSQTCAVGERFKEATHINRSLSVLSQVVMQLSQDETNTSSAVQSFISTVTPIPTKAGNTTISNSSSNTKKTVSKYVNYRDSKLTRILQSSLSGNAYIAMICTVTPASIDETISTLRFARTAKKIQTKPKVNHKLASEYQQKILDLQKTLDSKTYEVDDLKRRLEIFMKFSHTQRIESQNSSCQSATAVDRRKTICSSLLRRDPQLAVPALQSIAEEGIFQIPNKPPLPKKRSSCGDIISAVASEKFMSDEQARTILDQGEKTHVQGFSYTPRPKKARCVETDDAQSQTDDSLPYLSVPKRLRLEQENPPGTPPNTLRMQRSHLRIACEEEIQEKAELRAFHAAEIDVLNQQNSLLQEALDAAQARCQEFEEIFEIFTKGEITTMLTELKKAIAYDSCDVSTETETETENIREVVETRDCAIMAGVAIHSFSHCSVQTEKVEKQDFGAIATLSLSTCEASTETTNVKTQDFGAMSKMSLPTCEAATETSNVETQDFGATATLSLSTCEASTETSNVETQDFGATATLPTCEASTETSNVVTQDFGATATLSLSTCEAATETTCMKTQDFGATVTLSMSTCEAATETTNVKTQDFSAMATVSLPTCEASTETASVQTQDFAAMATVSLSTCETATETTNVTTQDFGATATLSLSTCEAATETTNVKTQDFAVMATVSLPTCEASTETTSVKTQDFGATATLALSICEASTETPSVETQDFGATTKLSLSTCEAATETTCVTNQDLGATGTLSPSTCDTATETTSVKTQDFGATATLALSICEASTETTSVETQDFGATAILSLSTCEAATETTCVKNQDFGATATLSLSTCEAATETTSVKTQDFGATATLSLPTCEAATETTCVKNQDFGATATLSLSTCEAATETISVKTQDFGATAILLQSTCEAATETSIVETRNFGAMVTLFPPTCETSTETSRVEVRNFGATAGVSLINMRETSTETTNIEVPVQVKAEFREVGTETSFAEENQASAMAPRRIVNRAAQTVEDSDYNALVKNCHNERLKRKTLQAAMGAASRNFDDKLEIEKRRIRDLEKQMALKESEKENLEHKITVIQKEHREQKPQNSVEVHCDIMKGQLEKAMQGAAGLLPEGYPRVDHMASEISSLKRELCALAIDRQKKAKEEAAILKQMGEDRAQLPFIKPTLLIERESEEKSRSRATSLHLAERRVLRSTARASRAVLNPATEAGLNKPMTESASSFPTELSRKHSYVPDNHPFDPPTKLLKKTSSIVEDSMESSGSSSSSNVLKPSSQRSLLSDRSSHSVKLASDVQKLFEEF